MNNNFDDFSKEKEWKYSDMGEGDSVPNTAPNTSYTPNTPPPIQPAAVPLANVLAEQFGKSSQSFGIAALITTLCCCPLIGLILGLVAISKSKKCKQLLNADIPQSKVGRICGYIALIIFVLSLVLYVFYFAYIMAILKDPNLLTPYLGV